MYPNLRYEIGSVRERESEKERAPTSALVSLLNMQLVLPSHLTHPVTEEIIEIYAGIHGPVFRTSEEGV